MASNPPPFPIAHLSPNQRAKKGRDDSGYGWWPENLEGNRHRMPHYSTRPWLSVKRRINCLLVGYGHMARVKGRRFQTLSANKTTLFQKMELPTLIPPRMNFLFCTVYLHNMVYMAYNLILKRMLQGWGCNSMVKPLARMFKALSSSPKRTT